MKLYKLSKHAKDKLNKYNLTEEDAFLMLAGSVKCNELRSNKNLKYGYRAKLTEYRRYQDYIFVMTSKSAQGQYLVITIYERD